MLPLWLIRAHVKPATSEEDELLRLYEEGAVAAVERVTGRYFGPLRSFTEIMDHPGGHYLPLRYEPAPDTAVTVTHAGGVEVPADDFVVSGAALLYATPHWGLSWPAYGRGTLTVSYTAGYPSTAADAEDVQAPADIRVLVLQLTAKAFELRSPVITGEAVAEVPGARDTLNAWKRLRA